MYVRCITGNPMHKKQTWACFEENNSDKNMYRNEKNLNPQFWAFFEAKRSDKNMFGPEKKSQSSTLVIFQA